MKASLIGAGVLLLIIVGLGIANWGQGQQIDALQAQKTALQGNLNLALRDNKDQADTIDTLQKANAQFARDIEAQHQKHAQTLQELATAKRERELSKARLLALEGKDRGSVSCEALLSTDLASVCPNMAAASKERAQ